MWAPAYRIVLDTNTLLRGLAAADSPAAQVRRAAERRLFVPLLSKPVLDEYREVLSDEDLVRRFPQLTPDLIEITMRRLRFVGDYTRQPRVKFEFKRDPEDQKFIELAIALEATHIITHDEDLLSLQSSRTEAGRRFRQRLPAIRVMTAVNFLESLDPNVLRP